MQHVKAESIQLKDKTYINYPILEFTIGMQKAEEIIACYRAHL